MKITLRPRLDPVVYEISSELSGNIHTLFLQYKRHKINAAILQNYIEALLAKALTTVGIYGYSFTCKHFGTEQSGVTKLELTKAAKDRASFAAKEIVRVSKASMMGAMSKKTSYSKARAVKIARYETSRMFFAGSKKAWKERKGRLMKQWATAGDDPCEICLDNEDQGPIPFGEPFVSGDYSPEAHVNCECYLELTLE